MPSFTMLALGALLVTLTLNALSVSGEVCYNPPLDTCELLEYTFQSATANQLPLYKECTKGPGAHLTTNTGRPIAESEFDIGEDLLSSHVFMEGLTSLVREPPIPRVVHTKGAGAFGYFEVTHDVSDIIDIDMFNEVGKITPAVARFSLTHSDLGSADTMRTSRGFAVKFFTQEGIFDLAMINFKVFSIKDPKKFTASTHVNKRNPQTFKNDVNMVWDFITSNQESAFFAILELSDFGIPCSYATMPGFSIHTFAFCNARGERYFGRFSLRSDVGVNKGMTSQDGERHAGSNPDYLNEDLYDRIASGNYPVWTLYVQALSQEDVNKESMKNVFDTTRSLDKKYPSRPIGKLYLNQNPENYLRDVELLTYCVAHLPSGIDGVDDMFIARGFSYLDAQNHRAGVNHNKIHVNRATVPVNTYQRDGASPLGPNGDNGPNYYPNAFNGPVPVAKSVCPRFRAKIVLNPNATNFEQAAEFVDGLSTDELDRLLENLVASLCKTALFLQERALSMFTKIHKDLGKRLELALEEKLKCPTKPSIGQCKQPPK